MADGAQENGIEFLELFDRTVGQDLASALVALTAEIEALVVQLDACWRRPRSPLSRPRPVPRARCRPPESVRCCTISCCSPDSTSERGRTREGRVPLCVTPGGDDRQTRQLASGLLVFVQQRVPLVSSCRHFFDALVSSGAPSTEKPEQDTASPRWPNPGDRPAAAI